MQDPALLDALPDALLVVRDGRVSRESRAATRLLAGSRIGVAVADSFAPGEHARWARRAELASDRGEPSETIRTRLLRADGAAVVVDLCAGHGAGGAMVLVARDASAAMRADALLGELADLPSRMEDRLDVDGLLDGAEPIFRALGWRGGFVEVQDGAGITRRALGFSDGDPIAEYARGLVGRRVPFAEMPIVAEVAETERPLFLDDPPSFQPGARRSAVVLDETLARAGLTSTAWCPVRSGGRISHVLALTGPTMSEHDFASIRLFAAEIGAALHATALREQLVRRERLAAVGEMAAVLAHEVRNPLAIIFNALGALGKVVPREEPAVALLGILGEESDRLRRLVEDLLTFARPTSPQIGPVDLAPVLQQALEAARQDATVRAAGVRCEVDVPGDVPRVDADAFLLRRAVLNLAVNAMQHVSRGGAVRIAARATPGGEVTITVRNDGAPIPDAATARLFEPFYTTQAAGTGLGLAIVKRIVEDLRARVDVAASDGGTEFRLVVRASADPDARPGA